MNRTLQVAVCAALWVLPALGVTASLKNTTPKDQEIAQLRAEFEQKLQALQVRYEVKLQEMEARLQQQPAAEKPSLPAANPNPTPAQSAFNPEISLILQGRYHQADGDGHISGYLPAAHAHGSGQGFSLDHTELVLSAAIDPYFRGLANFAVADETIETEEAWVQTTALGHGLTARFGRYLSGIGYINQQHPHAWDFANQNLAYMAMLGEHYVQDGIQLKWIAPTPLFFALGVEAAQGSAWHHHSLGSYAAFAHLGGDIGDSHAWQAGFSYLRTKGEDREGHWEDDHAVETETAFSGISRYWLADVVWKWSPNGNSQYQHFKFQAEYVRRDESGNLTCGDNTAAGGACVGLTDDYQADQSGWYAQAVYQFQPRWRAGYRYDALKAGSVQFGDGFMGILSTSNHTPRRHSLMLDYNPSEFSRLRLQLAQDDSEQGLTDHQISVQYIHSLGPHGAHIF